MSKQSSQSMAAKAKAMYGHLLKENDYQELLRKRSVQEIASFLKNETSFKHVLSGINENTIHRGHLEMLIRQAYFYDFLQLIRYGDSSKSKFYHYGILNIEIRQILITIRGFDDMDRSEQIAQLPMFANKLTSFDLQGLVSITSMDELIRYLKNTPYSKILQNLRPVGDNKVNFTDCELELKKYYYNEIEKIINEEFSGFEKTELLKIFHSRIELDNITNIYRLKKYYKATPNKIKSILNPIFTRISKSKLYQYIDNYNADEFLQVVSSSAYKDKLTSKDFDYIEYHVDKIHFNLNKHLLRFTSNPELILVSYMNMLEIEIQNLIDIIEGIRYKVENDKISKLLIY